MTQMVNKFAVGHIVGNEWDSWTNPAEAARDVALLTAGYVIDSSVGVIVDEHTTVHGKEVHNNTIAVKGGVVVPFRTGSKFVKYLLLPAGTRVVLKLTEPLTWEKWGRNQYYHNVTGEITVVYRENTGYTTTIVVNDDRLVTISETLDSLDKARASMVEWARASGRFILCGAIWHGREAVAIWNPETTKWL